MESTDWEKLVAFLGNAVFIFVSTFLAVLAATNGTDPWVAVKAGVYLAGTKAALYLASKLKTEEIPA